jgi:hypothetical protein
VGRQRVRWLVVALLAAVALVLPAAGAGAAKGTARALPVVGNDFVISGPGATSSEYSPQVAGNGAAGYLVVWEDDRNESETGSDIYGRLVAADGSRLGSDFRISGAGATGEETAPAVAWDATDQEYLVVWRDDRNGTTWGYDIYARRVAADGTRIGSDFRIGGPGATMNEDYPAVAWDASHNQYLVVRVDERNSPTGIYGRRVAGGGSPVGGDFRVSGGAAVAGGPPAIVWNAIDGEFLVTWADGRNPSADIYARRVPGGGSPVGGDIRISRASTSGEYLPGVAWNGTDDEYLIVWEDWRNYFSREQEIYGQRLAADGSRLGANFRVGGTATADLIPAVAWNDETGQYLVVWEDLRNYDSRETDIFGRLVAADGTRLGKDFRISGANALSTEQQPQVAGDGADGEFLVVWQDLRNYTGRLADVFGRRVAP